MIVTSTVKVKGLNPTLRFDARKTKTVSDCQTEMKNYEEQLFNKGTIQENSHRSNSRSWDASFELDNIHV